MQTEIPCKNVLNVSEALKRWLADDPHFLTGLNDLDRGPRERHDKLTGDADAGDTLPPDRAAAPRPPAPPPTAHDGAEPVLSFPHSEQSEHRPRRPLLELFPASMLEPEAPPPRFGAAVGPDLAFAPVYEPELPSRLDPVTRETFYGLREKPFSLSTDPRFHYHSAEHERAGLELLEAIRTRAGHAVLTGAPGTGTCCASSRNTTALPFREISASRNDSSLCASTSCVRHGSAMSACAMTPKSTSIIFSRSSIDCGGS